MTSRYATSGQFEARKSAAYLTPTDTIDQLLDKASELIDFATMGRAEALYTTTDDGTDLWDSRALTLANIACDQVEFWLEVGEEHDVVGLHGALAGGRVQVSRVPGYLGQRAMRGLLQLGLYYAGVPSR